MSSIKFIIPWFFVIIWMAIIFYLSHQPATTSSQLSSGITHNITIMVQKMIPFSINTDLFHSFVRKAAHFAAYFILGVLLMRALVHNNVFLKMGVSLLISVLYAISDEFHQTFIPGRSGEIRDVIIDTAGAVTGILLYFLIYLFFKKKKEAHL